MTMGDPRGNNFPGQQAGQPATTDPAGQPSQVTPEGSGYLTMEQVRLLVEQKVGEALQRAQAGAQSYADKMENRVSARLRDLDAKMGEMRAAGVDVPAALRDQERNRIIQEELQSSGGTDGGQGAHPGAAGRPDPLTVYVNTRANEIYQEYGVVVEETDPEAGMIEQDSPEKFLASLQRAVEAKRNRVGQPSPPAPLPMQGEGGGAVSTPQAAARMPVLGSGGARANPISEITDPGELLRLALSKR